MIAIICYGVVLFVVCFIALNAVIGWSFIDAFIGKDPLDVRMVGAIIAALLLGLELIPAYIWLQYNPEEDH